MHQLHALSFRTGILAFSIVSLSPVAIIILYRTARYSHSDKNLRWPKLHLFTDMLTSLDDIFVVCHYCILFSIWLCHCAFLSGVLTVAFRIWCLLFSRKEYFANDIHWKKDAFYQIMDDVLNYRYMWELLSENLIRLTKQNWNWSTMSTVLNNKLRRSSGEAFNFKRSNMHNKLFI